MIAYIVQKVLGASGNDDDKTTIKLANDDNNPTTTKKTANDDKIPTTRTKSNNNTYIYEIKPTNGA